MEPHEKKKESAGTDRRRSTGRSGEGGNKVSGSGAEVEAGEVFFVSVVETTKGKDNTTYFCSSNISPLAIIEKKCPSARAEIDG